MVPRENEAPELLKAGGHMKIRFGLTKKLVVMSAVVLVAITLVACYKSNETPPPKVKAGETDPMRPAKIAKAYVYEGGVCPIDSSNPKLVSNLISATRKLPLSIYGWATTESTGRPVGSMIFAVLSSTAGTYYLEGKRVPRPDVAKGNRLLDQVGFEVTGPLSNVPGGEYTLSIASGTEFVVAMCKTPVVVRISE